MAGAFAVLSAVLIAQAPDTSVETRYRAAIRRIGDSLTALDGVAAMFQSDLVNASPDLVISRSMRLRRRCVGTLRETDRLDALPNVAPRLRRELAALRAELVRCDREFEIGPAYRGADSVKAWAPYRLSRLGDAVRRFRLTAGLFIRERPFR